MIKKFLVVITFLFVGLNLFAQEDYLFENLSVADGLSSSSFAVVHNIQQDKYGFLWFGTADGLNRYDGYEFKVYKNIPGDTTSLPSSNILLVTEDPDGNLWIGTNGHMSMLDRKTDSFINYSIDLGTTPYQATINIVNSLNDSKGNIWIGTQGRSVQKWDKVSKRWNLIPFMLKVEGVDSLVRSESIASFGVTELRNGNLLSASFSEGVFYYNQSSNAFEPFDFVGDVRLRGILNVFEDRSGKIWFTGRNSFIEYNPITFSLEYKDGWKKLVPSGDTFLFNVNEREDGTFLFCSTPHGLMEFDPTSDKFDLMKIGGELEQRGIGKFAVNKIVDSFGVYWIGLADNGVLKFDPNRKPFKYYPFKKDSPGQGLKTMSTDVNTYKGKNDELIISTYQDGFLKFNIKDHSTKKLNVQVPAIYSDSSNLRNFVIDESNKLWFTSSSRYVSSYDLQTGKSESYKVLNNSMITGNGSRLRGIEYIPNNKLIISSSDGGFIFNTETKISKKLPSTMNRKYSDEFLIDLKNLLEQTTPLAAFTEVGEAANLNKKFMIEEETNVLVVCMGEGQYPQGIFDYGSIHNSDGEEIWAMNEIKNTFNSGGGYKNRIQVSTIALPPGEYSINYLSDVGHSYNNFNVVAPDNPEWYGIQVIKLDKDNTKSWQTKITNQLKKNDYPDMFAVNYTLNSRKYPSDIWVGANEKGLVKYDLSTMKYKQYSLKDFISSNYSFQMIFEDSKGRLWFTMNPTGFFRFDPITEKIQSNSDIPDLPVTGINGIIEDFKGNIWISSNGGITKISENKDGSWSTSNYDSKDGVPGGFGGGALVTRKGEIYFGAFNGLTAFYPSTENTSSPIPVITNINVSDVSVFDKSSEVTLDNSVYEADHLNLSFAQNDVSFEFAALHYSRPSKNRVSYKLEGFNDHWIYTDKNFASFTNLDPGDYTLRVKAISGFGVPSTKECTLSITVAPPWYRTTVAYVAYGFLFIGLVFGIDRFQRHRLLRNERERQKIQEAELRAIAAEAQAKAVEAENERKTKELEEARQLQLSMLPKKLPDIPNLDIAVYMQTATEVGGDYYDFHVGLDGTLTVVVGDATGHGMKAGTMVTAAKSLFSTHAANPDILFTFSEISRCIKHMDMHLLTMCMTVLKINQNRMLMSAAGMPPTLLFRENTKQLEEITIKGMPLGAFEEFPYTLEETALNKGDTLLLMSDGFPELFNNNKELYGYERVQDEFHKVAERSPEEIIDRLKSSASDWAGDSGPNDDVTFVVIKVK